MLLGVRQLAAYCSEIEHHATLQQFEESVALLHHANRSYGKAKPILQALREEITAVSA
jgi:hypothetical protein